MANALRIAVVPQGSFHQYWKFVQAGAKKAVRELLGRGTSVSLICKAPLREDDRHEQKDIVERLARDGVDGIVLAPFDSGYLVDPVERVIGAGIAVVIIDSPLESSKIVSFIATDNRKGGALAADRMGTLLDHGGRVLLMRYQRGVGSTEAREEGFADRAKMYSGMEVVHSDQYAGATRDAAKNTADTLLKRYANDLAGVFTPNESSTAGMLMALQNAQRAGKVTFVGFDASDMYLDTMRYRHIQGLVVQNPFLMGELGVQTLADHLEGKRVQSRIDLLPTMATPENIDSPEIQRLLHLQPV